MKLHRYASALTEIQAAVSQTRKWLDQKISPPDIAILHPDMESIWPVLSEYFRIEGIPCDKAIVSKVALHPEMQLLNSKLKLMSGEMDRSLLESVLFETAPQISYRDFVRRYHNFYGAYQTKNDLDIAVFVDALSAQEFLLREFLEIVVSKLSAEGGTWLQPVVQRMLSEVPNDLRWPFKLWIQYFERLASKTEIILSRGVSDGIRILNLESADWLSSRHIWVMGLNEEALKSFEPMGLSVREVLSLSQQTGFQLPLPDQRHKEFEALWLLEREVDEIHLSTTATDLSGQAQAASLIWLEKSIQTELSHDHLEQSESTRLSEIQNQFHQTEQAHDFGEFQISSLSATQIEKYLDCPFIFAAQRVFKLTSEPTLDLDLDPMSKGLLQHALFERLTEEPIKYESSDVELEQIIEDLRVRVQMGEDEFWPSVKKKYLKMARNFLDFEKQWRLRFPLTKTVAREFEIRAIWSQTQKKFIKEGSGIPFVGRIDRIDQNKFGDLVLIDYKASKNGLHHWPSWMESAELQLALYMLAIEDQATTLEHSNVIGAFYYVAKDNERHRGFRLKGEDETLFPVEDNIRNWMTQENKLAFIKDLRDLVFTVVDNIQKGLFLPRPRSVTLCERCAWRKLCRAPHLN